MNSKLDIEIRGVLLVGLCTLIFIMAGTMNGVGEGLSYMSYNESSETQAAHDYCVQMGYTYKSTPTLNNGQPICEFPSGSWCDADEYYTGQCTTSYNPYGLPNPYAAYYGYPQNVSIHTPYGDVPANAPYGGEIYVTEPYYPVSETGAEQAAWAYGAMSFLNAP